MATIPTQNAVPSEAPRDLKFNSGKIDEFVTSLEHEYKDRFGRCHMTIEGMRWIFEQLMERFKVDINQAIIAAGYIPMDSFQQGAEITKRNEILRDETTGEYYRWDGDLPKTVPAGSTPESAGGVGMGAWVGVGDASLRSQLSSPTGSALIGHGDKTVADAIDSMATRMDTLHHINSKMAAGETVKICCYGDSTTDGNATSAWVANPTIDGKAVGNSNHNLTAPNAWPIQLQHLLRKMYCNENIHVYNAGYSGKKLIDGWAYDNFDSAVTNNPYYGKCDAVIIDFGLNDITESSELVKRTILETSKLIEKIKITGAIPVLMTSGPTYRSKHNGDKDSNVVVTQINEIKKHISIWESIPLIDKSKGLLDLLNSRDDIKWCNIQSDGLHFSDIGHKIQAAYICNYLYSGITVLDGELKNINFLDAKANSFVGYGNVFSQENTLFGGNALISANEYNSNLSKPFMNIFLYANNVTDVIYMARGSDGQRYGSGLCKIKITDMITDGTVFFGEPSNVNINQGNDWLDQPLHLATISPGLFNVQYIIGDAEVQIQKYFGGFMFSSNWIPKITSFESRYIGNDIFPFSSSHNIVVGNNNYSNKYVGLGGNGRGVKVKFNIKLPFGVGFVIMGGMKGGENSNSHLAIYRGSNINLIKVKDNRDGTSWQLLGKISDSISTDMLNVEFAMERKNNITNLTISVNGSSMYMTSEDNAFDIPVGGYIGGSVSLPELTTTSGDIVVTDLQVLSYKI